MDYSLSGSSIHEIFQARILEWVAISFSRDVHPFDNNLEISVSSPPKLLFYKEAPTFSFRPDVPLNFRRSLCIFDEGRHAPPMPWTVVLGIGRVGILMFMEVAEGVCGLLEPKES